MFTSSYLLRLSVETNVVQGGCCIASNRSSSSGTASCQKAIEAERQRLRAWLIFLNTKLMHDKFEVQLMKPNWKLLRSFLPLRCSSIFFFQSWKLTKNFADLNHRTNPGNQNWSLSSFLQYYFTYTFKLIPEAYMQLRVDVSVMGSNTAVTLLNNTSL